MDIETIWAKIVKSWHVFESYQDFVGKTMNFSEWIVARFNSKEG